MRAAAIAAIIANASMGVARDELEALADCLGDPRKRIQRRCCDALAALSAHDARIAQLVRSKLDDPEHRARWGAAFTLDAIEGGLDLRALDALLEALDDRDGDVRWAAAGLIVRLGRRERAPVRRALLTLAAGGHRNARKMALYCLRDLRIGGDEVRSVISSAGTSAESDVRLAALSAMAYLGDGELAEVALRCLEADASEGVRRAAASTLGRLGNRSARITSALELAARQRADESLSKAARQALARLGRA